MPVTTEKRLTYDDYALLLEGAPYQLIEGELIMSPAPTPYHQRISRTIEFALWTFVREHDLGEVLHAPIDVYLSEFDTLQPDIIYIASERLSIIGEKRIEEAPDLVIEILSPSTAYYDLKAKKGLYEGASVREYWIVDPYDSSAEIYRNGENGFILVVQMKDRGTIASSLIKGFSIELEELFG